jgi:hypothetical protein
MDTRNGSVNYNLWGKTVPCVFCCPDGYSKSPPKAVWVSKKETRATGPTGNGICHLIGQDQSDSMYIYECNHCNRVFKRSTPKD